MFLFVNLRFFCVFHVHVADHGHVRVGVETKNHKLKKNSVEVILITKIMFKGSIGPH